MCKLIGVAAAISISIGLNVLANEEPTIKENLGIFLVFSPGFIIGGHVVDILIKQEEINK